MWEPIAEHSILYDFYGELLSEKSNEIFRLYYEENLSLGEIASRFQMSRQGVHETVRRAEEKLREYEEKLGLAKRFGEEENLLNHLKENVSKLEVLLEETGGEKDAPEKEALRTIVRDMRDEIACLEM